MTRRLRDKDLPSLDGAQAFAELVGSRGSYGGHVRDRRGTDVISLKTIYLRRRCLT